jgi:hypothetical protein
MTDVVLGQSVANTYTISGIFKILWILSEYLCKKEI